MLEIEHLDVTRTINPSIIIQIYLSTCRLVLPATVSDPLQYALSPHQQSNHASRRVGCRGPMHVAGVPPAVSLLRRLPPNILILGAALKPYISYYSQLRNSNSSEVPCLDGLHRQPIGFHRELTSAEDLRIEEVQLQSQTSENNRHQRGPQTCQTRYAPLRSKMHHPTHAGQESARPTSARSSGMADGLILTRFTHVG